MVRTAQIMGKMPSERCIVRQSPQLFTTVHGKSLLLSDGILWLLGYRYFLTDPKRHSGTGTKPNGRAHVPALPELSLLHHKYNHTVI